MRDVFDLIGAVGGPKEVGAMLQAGAGSDKADEATRRRHEGRRPQGRRAARPGSAGGPAPALELRPLIESKDPDAGRGGVAAGRARCDSGAERADLEKLGVGAGDAEPVRLAAVEALAEIGKSPEGSRAAV